MEKKPYYEFLTNEKYNDDEEYEDIEYEGYSIEINGYEVERNGNFKIIIEEMDSNENTN